MGETNNNNNNGGNIFSTVQSYLEGSWFMVKYTFNYYLPKSEKSLPIIENKNSYELKPNITYFVGNETTPMHRKHKLDLYIPQDFKDNKEKKTIIFIHGGGWCRGDKDWFFGRYANVGKCFANEGYPTAIICYRLSPFVRHPEHVRDVARAIKWVSENISQYGGNPKNIYLCGESAGGHLAALAGLNTAFLSEVNVNPSSVRGVIGVSGVYDIQRLSQNPVARYWYLLPAFGLNPNTWSEASPVKYVQKSSPPFLLFNAQYDFHLLEDSIKLKNNLEKYGIWCKNLLIPQSHHFTLAGYFDNNSNVLTNEIFDFLKKT